MKMTPPPGNDNHNMREHHHEHHITDLLPGYVTGALSERNASRVRTHLFTCAPCAAELRAWQQIAAAEQSATRDIVAPSLALLDRVWAELDAPVARAVPAVATSAGASPSLLSFASRAQRLVQHNSAVALRQLRLLRPSIWLASATAILLATLFALLLPAHDELGVSGVLTFALPLIAAAGTAFLYGPESDSGLESALATPTSSRTIMASRFLWVFGYNTTLALLATLALAQIRGDGFWALAQHWLGQMALLSSISLALSLLLGPASAVGGSLILWLARVLHLGEGVSVHLTPDIFWQTTPQMIVIATLLLALALWYAPRHERLAQ